MQPFEQLIYDRFCKAIAAWDTATDNDIYALGFLCEEALFGQDSLGRDVITQGQISLSYNTLSHFEAQNTEEARWNYAFWLQNVTASVPRDFQKGEDPPADDLALRDAWCASLGIPPEEEDEAGRVLYDEQALNAAIHSACQHVALALHQNNIIINKIGRPVPVIIQDLEQSAESLEATKAANPPGLFKRE